PTLANDFMTLFKREKKRRPIAFQSRFETRERVELDISCHILKVPNNRLVLALELFFNHQRIHDVQGFLKAVQSDTPHSVTPDLVFDLEKHCFHESSAHLLETLIVSEKDSNEWTLAGAEHSYYLVSPFLWDELLPILIKMRSVCFIFDGRKKQGIPLSDELLPVHFHFNKTKNGQFLLTIKGLDQVEVLDDYHLVFYDAKLKPMVAQDAERLKTLQQMLLQSHQQLILFSENQGGFLKDKVIPSLRRVGYVTGIESFSFIYKQPTLKAKLFLDRIGHRLLAGLEFHYDEHVINPLEDKHAAIASFIERDLKKENDILRLMKESRFTETDSGFYLHNTELEYHFLVNILPELQQLAEVYATTAVRNRIIKDGFRPQIRVRVKKERTNWLEFQFKMDGISNDDIRDILQALEEKRTYYRLPNDTLLSLESKSFDEVRRLLLNPAVNREDLLSGMNMSLTSGIQLLSDVDTETVFDFDESFEDIFSKLKNPRLSRFDVPNELEPILRPYQAEGFQWLKTLARYGFGGVLADDMGLGKTIQSIAYIVSELDNVRQTKRRMFIVCPSSLTYNWLYEIQHFAPSINVQIIDGSRKRRRSLLQSLEDTDVVLTSYSLLRSDIDRYEKEKFHTIFFDEAQSFKNPLSQTARAVKRLQADHRFALTGTPLENALEDLWAIFHVVFPELFSGINGFSTLTRANISKRIRPFMLRRMKKDVLEELPNKRAMTDGVELLPEQKKLYAAYLAKLRHDTLKHLDKETMNKNRIRILAGLTRLRQICSHPGLFIDGYKGGSSKFNYLMTLLDQAEHSGRRVLIFSQFTKMLAIIRRALMERDTPFFYLDGETPSEKRVELCDRFNHGERDVFLISLKAGGTGLNLTGADTVILYDSWWNPAVEEQATDRAYRIGQKKDVQVIKLISTGTVEEKINALLDKKRRLFEEVIDSVGAKQASLTEEDLREILNI
ncbi:MAG: DEAD/DEAH box helicase, partial [Tuberibacillus sp.]